MRCPFCRRVAMGFHVCVVSLGLAVPGGDHPHTHQHDAPPLVRNLPVALSSSIATASSTASISWWVPPS